VPTVTFHVPNVTFSGFNATFPPIATLTYFSRPNVTSNTFTVPTFTGTPNVPNFNATRPSFPNTTLGGYNFTQPTTNATFLCTCPPGFTGTLCQTGEHAAVACCTECLRIL
jgi:hypothetical protein